MKLDKKQTAMQELWEYIISDKENIDQKTYVALRKKVHPLIEKEKQQIIDAFDNGDFENTELYTAEQYYNKTFNK